MNIPEFLNSLAQQQIQLFLEDGRLRYRAAHKAPSEEVLAQIRQRRAALMDYLHNVPPALCSPESADAYALSQGQEALWFLYELDRSSLAYNTVYAARLSHDVDRAALKVALQSLQVRHAALRSRFGVSDGKPYQHIIPNASLALGVTEVNSWSRDDVERYIAKLTDQPFDLERGPIACWHLLTGVDDGAFPTSVLILVVHHIAVDFRSLEILFHDLTHLYCARQRGETPILPALPRTYRDYVHWSQEWLQSEPGREAHAYWLEQLSGDLPVLNLPTDFARPPHQQYSGATLLSTVPPDLTARLKAFARQHLVTPYVVLLSTLGILLNRYSSQNELLIGSPMLGRSKSEWSDLVGYFVNPVVLRLRFDDDPDGLTVLAQVRRTTLEALSHQDYPFSLLVEDLRPQRDPSRSPLFQVAFVYERESGAPAATQGLFNETLLAGQRGAVFDLTLTALERGDTLRLTWEYATALFHPATVKRMIGHYQQLLGALLEQPEVPVSGLALLSDAEEQQLRAWNETRAPYPADQTLADLFAAQAAMTPDANAVECAESQLTYRELDARASRLARHLQAMGVGRNTLVGIALPRSTELIISVLGVLKAGGACLPLDMEHPVERLGFVLRESAASVLLTQAELAACLPACDASVIHLDLDCAVLTQGPATAPTCPATADDLLYVLYTSGSTGQPKGVAMSHRPLVNLITWQSREPGLDQPARVLQYTPLTFDVAFQEIATTLCGGGTLVLIDEERRRDSSALLDWLAKRSIERLFLPFVALQHLAESAAASGMPQSLCDIITAGEQLRITPAIRRSMEGSRCRLHNHYGPTESHVVTAFRLPEAVAEWEALPPIGRPIANVEIHLLDGHRQLVPAGVPGELYIAGAALASGYLNRPELTAERFIEHPELGRLYRTGDLARWRPDGTIEYLGRRDNQIKLRGFRVELGEIEAVLSRHRGVYETAVIVHGEGESRRLAAYVAVGPQQREVTAALLDGLDAHLRQHLPSYMLPATITALERLPQTPSGKVDRRALPSPERVETTEFVSPRNETEALLAALWASLLDLPRVGVTANFFELGGHSLLATRLIARIRDSFGIELPLQALFDHPSIAGLAKLIERRQDPAPLPPLTVLPSNVEPPLSFGQQRLWFLERLEGPSATYNMPATLALRGPLDEAALRRALESLVARHSSLRLYFPAVDGQPKMRLLDTYNPLSVTDLSVLGKAERDAEAHRLSQIHAAQPFDLAHGPLLRLHLLRFDGETHWLLFNIHHIISDGWSLGVLLRELASLYEGGATALPPLSVQYPDYAAWQRQWLQGEVLDRQLAYWRQQLADAPNLLELPSDRLRPPRRSYRGGLWRHEVDAAVTTELHRFNRAHSSTLFMTLLAVLDVLLSRYSGQTDLLVGSPLANRHHSQTEDLIGFFVNTLVLRARLEDQPSFGSLLAQVRQTCLDAHAHQDLPFEYLVEQLQPERSLSHSPLFQVMFVLQNTPAGQPHLPGLTVENLPPSLTVAKFDLTLSAEEFGGRLRLIWEYNADLFVPERIERMGAHFEQLLSSALAHPELPVTRLDLLTPVEKRQLAAWGQGLERELDWTSVVEAFESQAARTPGAPAVVCGDRILNYRRLNQRANQLSYTLQQRGVKRGDTVALCLPRNHDMVVGVLGVLKAGAAYLPLDPTYPAARLGFMLADASAAIVLSHSSLRDRLPSDAPPVCWLDRDDAAIRKQLVDNPAPQAGPEEPAYVIYTSGSTGQPKGVGVLHRGFANLVHWYGETLGLTGADRVLLISAIGFDLTQKNLFAPLLAGGSLHLPTSDNFDPEGLASDIETHGITWINCTPSTFYPLIAAEDPSRLHRLATLRWVVLGGEAIQMAQLRAWLASPYCQARVLNSYGPTECTDICAAWPVDGNLPEDSVPLGRPITNVRLAVLDAQLQPIPAGLPGELCVGGIGLGTGYHHRPDLTAERFVEVELFGRRERLYRTGDRVRWRADSSLDFLGRFDHQVKLRGFRIELGEIEAALLDLPGICAAVAIMHGSDSRQQLVAYVVDDGTSTPDALQTALVESLPAYMVPAKIVRLDRLPLTPNGKIDHAALPEPKDMSVTGTAAPQTFTETLLAEIWADLLNLEQVDRNADFFELGGHSLLATQVIGRVHDNFGINLPLALLFEQPTVASLAAAIDAEKGQRLPPLTPLPPDAELVPSFSQQRLWFLDQLEEDNTAYNMPASLALRGPLDEVALRRALRHVVERHASLRLCFPTEDGRPRARLLAPDDPLSFSDLSHLSATDRSAESERLQAEHAGQSFRLAEGPLFRLHLVRLEQRRHQLLFNMHHIVSDGWSIDLLIREIGRLYSAYHRGEVPDLPPLPIQYSDFAAWQRQWLQGTVLEEQLHYWRGQLADAPELMALPTDFPRPALLRHRGGVVMLKLDAGLVGQLRRLARAAGGTLFMALMTAFNILLYRYTGQTDLCVGTPVANRSHGELEHLVGLFLNTLVVRTRIPPAASFYRLLAEVRRVTLEAYVHQDVPFEYLVEQLSPLRSLSHNPVFQVMLNLVNTRSAEVALDGLEIEHLDTPPGQLAKFDLSLSFIEDPDGSLDGRVDYNTELFTEETVSFLGDCFVRLVAQIVARPDAPLEELTLVNTAWRDRTAAVRRPQPALPPVHFGTIEQSIPSRFAAQVRAHPERIAVRTPTTTLTYRELDQAARGLAAALLDLAATPRVALLLPHEAVMAVGILGVLQAGLTYVPLDSAHGIERLGLILDDTGASVIVCSAPFRPLAEQLAGPARHIVNLDELRTAPTTNLPAVAADCIAYLLYTSGSMGQPKGVLQSHRNVLHFIRQYTERLRIRPEDRLLQVASYAFDAGVMDIFGALLNGAALYPVDLRQTALSEGCDWLAREAVTIFHATPTVYRHVVEVLDRPLPAVRLVVLGGEAVVRSDVEAFRRHFGRDCLFVNGLGPTESTVTLQYFLDHTTPVPRFNVPVGYPVGDTEVLLLDAEGKVSELYGEITISSAHVALGYWQQDSASFSDDPEHPGKRRYRTGDLARLLPDGSLEAVGRCDNQVKLRGFRIELGEIEAVLRQHPEVRQAVVILWTAADDSPMGPADRRLVAYVGGTIRPADLKAYAQQKLPDYMVPAVVIVLPSLPMTITGKLDRRGLPPPSSEMEEMISVAPRTETEALLANLWSVLLGVPVTGVGSNFFELGGHSLLATRLISRIRDSFAVDLPLRTLFEHPVLHDQAALLDQSRRGDALPLIEPRPDAAVLPLSFAQQRLWFLAQLQAEAGAVYTISAALRLDGPLDQTALRTALRQLTARQLSLRMNFPSRAGQPAIALRPPYDPLRVEPLRPLPGETPQAALERLAAEHARRPFALAHDPLLRLTLLELSDQAAVLLFSIHHIIADGWSLGVLVRELSVLYAAACGGVEADLPPLPIHYPDYAAWQRQWLSGEVLERQLTYWREQLAGVPSLLMLPTDSPRPAVKTYGGAQLSQELDPEIVGQLKSLSRSQGATLYMTLLAAFSVLLSRYSGQEDVVVGSPIANRTQSQTEALIGFFVNTLLLRSRVTPQQSFSALLAEVRQTALAAYAHQDVPFEKLVDELQPERSLGHSPLFQVMFALQNAPSEAVQLAGVQVRSLNQATDTAKFDLVLSMAEEAGGRLVGVWEYSTDLFAAPTIARMAAHFAVLLRGIVADPEQALSRLPLLMETEQQELAVWNATATSYPRQETVAGLFAAQAAVSPQAVALVDAGRVLSYGELEERANQLAHYLKARCAPVPDQVIGLCLERSPELIVGMLAILKAGAAYLPLDADYPAERLRLMLEDADVSAIVTHSSLKARLPEGEAELICLDQDGSAIAECPAQALASAATAESLAYVMYTSGSTGHPKGVCVPQRAVVRLVKNTNYARLDAEQVFLQYAPVSFDAATFEIWGPLLNGAKLVLMPPAQRSLAELGAVIQQQGITALWLTASLFNLMIDEYPAGLQGLQQLLVGGEALSVPHVRKALEQLPGCQLINGYGPTENTTFTCCYAIEKRDYPFSIPIGAPIANSTVYILDAQWQPVPVGIAGELYIGGDGLARGYWKRPELTAERFLEVAGLGRVYRTGDLGRWRADGTIEFLGRVDGQVKLRGFRIEPEEIEAVLRQEAEVKDAVVVVHGEAEQRQLVAYLVPAVATQEVAATRQSLRRQLPDYMVPSAFVLLDALPLTSNGKVDYCALPAPDHTRPELGKAFEAPRTEVEEVLAWTWAEVLGLERVGVHDNFFELGGHSLLATQIISRLRDAFRMELPLRQLFEAPTVASLAEWIEAIRWTMQNPQSVLGVTTSDHEQGEL